MSASVTNDKLPVKPGEYLAGGKYLVDAVLGVGGMGVVVAATHVHLKQPVAIKFMLPNALENEEAVQRFLLEARSAAALRSEHVARVLDVGTLETGAPYIVMEFLQGITLDNFLEQGDMPTIAEAVEYTVHACEAVAEAHAREIMHRDLKLSNLFLTIGADKRPMVKVIDFGLSKSLGTDSKKITKDFSLMGTPAYMSPEQLKARGNVDARTDLWSLGVCLYELLTGHVPFEAESVAEICANVLNEPPVPVRTYRAEIPEGLAAVIDRCLQKDPDLRFSTVAELACALDPYLPVGSMGAGERIHRVQSESVAPPRFVSQTFTDPSAIRGTVSTWGRDGLSELVPSRQSLRGWFALMAIAAIVGIGAISFALVKRSEMKAPAAAAPPEASTAIAAATASASDTSAPITPAGPAASSESPSSAGAVESAQGAQPRAPSSPRATGGVTKPAAPRAPASADRDKLLETR